MQEEIPPNSLKFNRVNLEVVKNSKEPSKIVTSLANTLSENPYYTVAQFFKDISDSDLESLSKWLENINDDSLQSTNDFVLLTLMLIYAEGLEAETLDDLYQYVNIFGILVPGVSLSRKGLVRIFWENMTLSLDITEQGKPLFERII